MTKDELFERAITCVLNEMAEKENTKALKDEAKESGLDAKLIGKVMKCAKLHVDNTFEEKTAEQRDLESLYKELTGYDE